MPLGVEHTLKAKRYESMERVFLPLMPLGVEHKEDENPAPETECVPTFDAVRR